MINKFLPLAIIILVPASALGVESSYRGYLSAKAQRYTTEKTNEHTGQRHRAQVEQEVRFNENALMINQLRWNYSSLYTDVSNSNTSDKKDDHDLYLGDNYVKYKSDSWVLQTGYQEVAWGEAFGFNYADIINPKDLKETFYSDYSESRLPLFLMNFKYFFENGSLQLLYSPEPRFSKALPVSLFTKGILPQTNVITHRQKAPDFFKEHEFGPKISTSFWGLDASIFYFNYLERDPYYTLESATGTVITLKENHERVQSAGLSVAKTIYDNFVFRTDIVYTKDKKENSVSGLNLINTKLDSTNILVSLDTPTYYDISAIFIVATSRLSKNLPTGFREQNETFSILKLSYDLKEEKVFDLSYTHQFTTTSHALQALFTWPVSPTLEVRLGGEHYWGEAKGQLSKIESVSNVFFGIKNYFQL